MSVIDKIVDKTFNVLVREMGNFDHPNIVKCLVSI